METKSRYLCILYHCLILNCFVFNLFFTVYIYLDLQTLRKGYEELQQNVADNTLQIKKYTELNTLNADNVIEQTLSRKGRQLTSHNLISDLIHAQAQILQTHCANNSRLCMQGPKGDTGPKGETGPKGDTGSPGVSSNPNRTCACFISPTIHSGNAIQHIKPGRSIVLDCSASGNPDPFITWLKDGVRITSSSMSQLTATNPGNYTCTAENIVGMATFSFSVT